MDSEPLVNSIRERPCKSNEPENSPENKGKNCPQSGSFNGQDLSASDDNAIGPVSTILLTKNNFEMMITDPSENTTDIIANTDFHAFFIKDKTSSSYLDEFKEATSGIGGEDSPPTDAGTQTPENSGLYMPFVERLRNKAPETRVVFTVKQKVPDDLGARARKYVDQLCRRLGLSDHDSHMICGAADIHDLAKLRYPYQNPGGFKRKSDVDNRSLRLLNDHPVIVRMLRSMYGSLPGRSTRPLTLELAGANILTIVDLFCDSFQTLELLTQERFKIISGALENLIGRMFLEEVCKTFVNIIKEDVRQAEKSVKSSQIIIYSDRSNNIYPLKTRLSNAGLSITVVESLDSFIELCKTQSPAMVVLRLHSRPHDIIKTVNLLSNKGIDLKGIPAFLLVKGSTIQRLASLFEMGIEDIIDLDSSIDVLVLKIKKVLAQSGASQGSRGDSNQSGSRGNLSEMNLIDLLQALGPSQRTARITVNAEDLSSDPLLMYLSQGNIIFAQLGDLMGETAIHKAIAWERGTWVVEQVASDDLPEPNNHVPNEAILMEGCRLLDESTRDVE